MKVCAAFLAALIAVMTVTGCAREPYYTLAPTGISRIGRAQLVLDKPWSRVNSVLTSSRSATDVFTLDGWLLNRVIVVSGVPDGQSLLKDVPSGILPVFRAGMLPNELAELLRATLIAWGGEGQVLVQIQSIAPDLLAGQPGVRITYALELADGTTYTGFCVMGERKQRLTLFMYSGIEPYYADLRRPDAERLLATLKIR